MLNVITPAGLLALASAPNGLHVISSLRNNNRRRSRRADESETITPPCALRRRDFDNAG